MTEENNNNNHRFRNGTFRLRLGAVVALLGLLIFIFGANPGLFGLDRSPVVGFIQISVFTVGLLVICLGGFICVEGMWSGIEKNIAAEFGVRLVGTGFVVAAVSAMADVFGLGTRPFPKIPFFGYWQARGVLIGEVIILLGFVLTVPLTRRRKDNKPAVSP